MKCHTCDPDTCKNFDRKAQPQVRLNFEMKKTNKILHLFRFFIHRNRNVLLINWNAIMLDRVNYLNSPT